MSESSSFSESQGYPTSMSIFSKMGRQLAVQFWLFLFAGLTVFTSLFLVADILGNSSQFTDVSRLEMVTYYYYMLPEVMYRMLPVASVIGVIFTLAQLQRTNEMVALFSLGVSLWQVTGILMFWTLVASALNFYLGDQVMPRAIQNKNYLYYHQIMKKPSLYSTVKTGKIWYKVKDTIFYLKTLNPQANRGEGLKMFMIGPDWKLMQMVEAKQVEFQKNIWQLKEGVVTIFSEDSSFPMTQGFTEKTIVMAEEAGELAETAKPSDVLTMGELRKFISRNKAAGLDTMRYEVDYFSKWSFAFAGCIMALLAIPFSIQRGRAGGVMSSVGVVLVLVFIFWTLYSSGLAMGYHGRVPPLFAATVPSLLMGAGGIFAIRRTGR